MDESPVADEAYGFAAFAEASFTEDRMLRREAAYEIGMEFTGLDDESAVYKFKLARPHQGHEYYYGSSGAPIADPSGKIVSLVLGGCESRDEIFGLPLAKYQKYTDLQGFDGGANSADAVS